tara:strand:+ start:3056 stop:3415 length:360 start_codon:yes stop_codon:yes gene_type:complete
MGFRCELCDEWLPILSFCKLCPTCYKLRTIVKCYNAEDVLEKVEDCFLVSHARQEEEKKIDEEFFRNEETRIGLEFEAEIKRLEQQEADYNKNKKLETIKEEKPLKFSEAVKKSKNKSI